MKVILLSIDGKIWANKSGVRERVREYATLVKEVHVFVFGKNKQKEVFENNLFLHPVNAPIKFLAPLVFLLLVFKIIRKYGLKKTDTIVDSQDPFELGFLAWFLKIFFGFKLQFQIHIDFYNLYYRQERKRFWWHYYLAQFLLPRADRIRVVSNRIKNYLAKNLNIATEKIVYLPILFNVEYGVGKTVERDLHQIYSQFDKIVLMASRLVAQKNIALAIQSFKKSLIVCPKSGLLIVGSGPLKKQLQETVGDCPSIIFEDWKEDLFSYYKTADIFLLSSNYEGWGMTVVEAVTCGLPVIMTDVGCAGDFLIDGYNGKIVPVNEVEAMSAKITKLLCDEQERQILANNALLSINKLPSKTEYLNNIKKSWEDCLKV